VRRGRVVAFSNLCVSARKIECQAQYLKRRLVILVHKEDILGITRKLLFLDQLPVPVNVLVQERHNILAIRQIL